MKCHRSFAAFYSLRVRNGTDHVPKQEGWRETVGTALDFGQLVARATGGRERRDDDRVGRRRLTCPSKHGVEAKIINAKPEADDVSNSRAIVKLDVFSDAWMELVGFQMWLW